MSATLVGIAKSPPPELAEMIMEQRGPDVSAVLRGLHDPDLQAAFDDYADAMATRPIADILYSYADPSWSTVKRHVAQVALDMDLVPLRDRSEVREMALRRLAPTQLGHRRDRGRGPSR